MQNLRSILSPTVEEKLDFSLCLVGRFVTNKSIRFLIMKEMMAAVWMPLNGITITEIEPSIFLFRFYHNVDVQHVLNGGPWSLDKHMMILGAIKNGEDPAPVPLFSIPIWVQEHNLLVGFMSQVVGENLRNLTRKFLEYDEKNNANLLRSVMHIRVLFMSANHS